MQCPLGQKIWEPPKPDFFVILQQQLVSDCLDLVTCGVWGGKYWICACANVSVHKGS